MKIIKNVEQLAAEYAPNNDIVRKAYQDGATDMLETISKIVYDKGFSKIPRLQELIEGLRQ